MQVLGRRLSLFKKKIKRWDHDTERNDFYEEEVERKKRAWLEQRKTKGNLAQGSVLLDVQCSLQCLMQVGEEKELKAEETEHTVMKLKEQ